MHINHKVLFSMGNQIIFSKMRTLIKVAALLLKKMS